MVVTAYVKSVKFKSIFLAGTPITTVDGATDLVTTAPAPTIA